MLPVTTGERPMRPALALTLLLALVLTACTSSFAGKAGAGSPDPSDQSPNH